jgi:hypothetical protein
MEKLKKLYEALFAHEVVSLQCNAKIPRKNSLPTDLKE